MSTAKSEGSVRYAKFSPFDRPSVVRQKRTRRNRPRSRVLGFGATSMLRAALIGFGQTGKTTLFQLMTSAREAARAAHGKGEATIGISKVPDERLDRLTAMFNPKKRVPATIEFADHGRAGPGRQRAGAGRRRRVQERRRARPRAARVCRSGRAAPVGIDRPRARRAGHGGRADPGGPRRRRAPARTAREGPQEGQVGRSRARTRRRDAVPRGARRRTAAALARSAGRRPQAAARLSVPVGQAAADRPQPRRAVAGAGGNSAAGGRSRRADAVSLAGRHGGRRPCARRSSSRSRSSSPPTRRRSSPTWA